ncbi:2-oxoglutarate and iron-dependent oxygenase domain-containing protein [Aspergillus lucknowensis]|uniref:Non-haem dioxygenase N-terminal domain-containing protein n=1 Tax=Aspergillus lucknowensis TaxID=176173 RepID=A0ABR4LQE1_9EURO
MLKDEKKWKNNWQSSGRAGDDRSQYDQPGGKDELVKRLEHALQYSEVGFFYVKNFNISQEEVDRQFALGREFYALPLEERFKYHNSSDLERGEYNGYRPAGHRILGNGIRDNVQPCTSPKSSPSPGNAHTEDIEKLLHLVVILLELPDEEQLVRDQRYDVEGEDHLRYVHHAARSTEENKLVDDVYCLGHTGLGIVALLFPQPVVAL